MENLQEILTIINAPEIQAKLLPLKILSILFAIFVIVIIYIGAFRTKAPGWLTFSVFADITTFLTYRPFGFRKIGKRKWGKITARLQTGSEAEYKLAVMEANTMLDDLLKKMRIRGDTIDERLQNTSEIIFPNLEELQEFQRIRNNIVYDPDYRLSSVDARKILEGYEKAFRALDLI